VGGAAGEQLGDETFAGAEVGDGDGGRESEREVANGLLAIGFAERETASILSNTNIEWVLADFAVLSCNGICSGIYPTDAASQALYLCEDSSTTVVFVENDEQLDKILEIRDQLPKLRHIVVFDMKGLTELQDPQVISLDALRALGRDPVVAPLQARRGQVIDHHQDRQQRQGPESSQ
jgi:long-chain acyl-CoA synthetase